MCFIVRVQYWVVIVRHVPRNVCFTVCVCVSVWFCVSVPVRVRASVRPRARVCAGSAQSCVRKGRISRRKEKKDREREIMLTQSIGGKEKPCKQFFF